MTDAEVIRAIIARKYANATEAELSWLMERLGAIAAALEAGVIVPREDLEHAANNIHEVQAALLNRIRSNRAFDKYETKAHYALGYLSLALGWDNPSADDARKDRDTRAMLAAQEKQS